MPLKSKHIVEELNSVRCTVVEKGITKERCDFLKKMLEFNNFEVVIAEDPKASDDTPLTFTLGVTDLVFNPVIAVYEMALKSPDGGRVSPDYWDQKMAQSLDQYWLTPEEIKPGGSAWFYRE